MLKKRNMHFEHCLTTKTPFKITWTYAKASLIYLYMFFSELSEYIEITMV